MSRQRFLSGDIGRVDKEGFLRITDRKKDIIVTANGKNVAPQKIENLLKSSCPLISQVVVHGDQRPFLSALITLDPSSLNEWAKNRSLSQEYKKLTKSNTVRDAVDQAISGINQSLARFEQIKKYTILDHDFVVGEQLTPTLKVKRNVCNQRYRSELDSFYRT